MPETRTKIGGGVECEVFDVDNGRCYKKYGVIEEVEIAYENAKLAFAAGIAPEVYGKDDEGYYTEIVETFSDLCNDNYECDGICDESICDYALDIIGREEYEELCAKICEVFGECADCDLHIHNIGRKNGKLIAIDFGISSGLESGEND